MKEVKEAMNQLCNVEYPVSVDTIRERCGDNEIELGNGDTTTIKEILDLTDDIPEEFATEDELRNHLMSFIPEGCIGRKYYDDRGNSGSAYEYSF